MIEGDYSLVGTRSGRKFKMGDKVWIKIIAANLEKRQLDYQWLINKDAEQDAEQATGEKKAPRKKVAPKKARAKK